MKGNQPSAILEGVATSASPPRNDGALIMVIYTSRGLLRTYLVICSNGSGYHSARRCKKMIGCASPGRRVFIECDGKIELCFLWILQQ